jgi:Holliday junction resolvase RusA-like endonuclease
LIGLNPRLEGFQEKGTKMFFRLEGRIPSKKNSKQIIRTKGRPMIISSSEHNKWEKSAVLELRVQAKLHKIEEPIDKCDVYIGITFPDNRKTDLSNKLESIMDALVLAGILQDDCWQVVRSINVFQFASDKVGANIEVVRR